MLKAVKEQFESIKMAKLEEIQKQWNSKKLDLKAAIEEELENIKNASEEESADENGQAQTPKEQIVEVIRLYLNEGKYKEAFRMCRSAGQQFEEFQLLRENNVQHEADLYMLILNSIFISVNRLVEELRMGNMQGIKMSEDDFKKMEALETDVDFLQDCVAFLKLIGSAILPMTELLETTAIGDMQEAIEFFISAYQFNIDNASLGILAMLKIMQRNEQERKDRIIDAFKKIYLSTDTTNMEEHCTTIVNRLIMLVKTVPLNNADDLQLIISEWAAKGILDNGVVDMLWQYFTRKVAATEEDSRAALELLRMTALGRKTIIARNVILVATIAFGERGENDMLFLGSACEFLAVAGRERIDITSKSPPFRMNADHEMFTNLSDILVKKFFEPVEYYNKALFGGVDFIYKYCSKPEYLCETLIFRINNRLAKELEESEDKNLDRYIIVRLCQLLGFTAVKHLEYLDETVYKELKRRNNVREERKESKRKTNGKKAKKNQTRKSAAITTANETSLLNTSVADESTLEGAQAEDTDAEFILNVLENYTVTESGGLGKLAYIIKGICERPDKYEDVMIQGAAVIALIRYMLVSSHFCAQHIQLLFTIFEKTAYPEVKCSILVHLSDLLTRFPNIIEPWTPRIYQRLKDPLDSIRKATFFTLSNLILRDMIRAHSHISEMVCCLVDEDQELSGMCKTFFINLSHKENNLYNVLPDIFSHLVDLETMSEENLRMIMKFLFDLMDKTKHTENLVDRFCCKFRLTEDLRHQRNITYCLSLIQYNEKALRKLLENFPTYKHLVHDPEIYASFKSIMQAGAKQQVGKADLKPIIAEIEKSINSVFELNEDGNLMRPPPVPPKSARKPRGKAAGANKKKANRRRQDSDSEEDMDDDERESVEKTPARRSKRSKAGRRIVEDSDSD